MAAVAAPCGVAARENDGVRAGAGLAGIAVAVAAMLALPPSAAAGAVLATGAVAVAWSAAKRRLTLFHLRRTVDVPVLAGLFALAVVLGVVGRVWAGPEQLLAHASSVEAALLGAGASVAVNNLPAASLLAARAPEQAHALLIGLDLGPNLAVTGALSAVLWLQVSRTAGTRPSPWRYSRVGVVVVAVSMTAALAALTLVH